RLEAMHHLKTVAEAYIVFNVVVTDPTDATAERLMAQQVHKRVTRLQETARPEQAELLAVNIALRDDLFIGRPGLASLQQLARQHSEALGGWYSSVYRLACEPAHLGDLWEFMPAPDGPISTAPATTTLSHATVATYYGLRVLIATLRVVAEGNDLG